MLKNIADELYRCQTQAQELEKVTLRYENLDVEKAYEIQRLCIDNYLLSGDRLAGWKMGLTSRAKQQSVGVGEPIYGRLLTSMEIVSGEVSLSGLIHPRVEPEFAFIFKKPLQGGNIASRDVWLATECIVPAVEIIDSRYENFSFTLVDVIADNASSAGFLLGNQAFSPYQFRWDEVGVVMKRNGEVSQTGTGAAVLGHPVRAVVELVRMLHQIGARIEPGMVLLTGGVTEAIPIQEGDRISVEFDEMGTLSLSVRK